MQKNAFSDLSIAGSDNKVRIELEYANGKHQQSSRPTSSLSTTLRDFSYRSDHSSFQTAFEASLMM